MAIVQLFTDGACSGNPGPGGWAYILRHLKTGIEKEASGADRQTTNNRMELQAVIQGLLALRKPCEVGLFTDSVYVGKGLSQWMPKWKMAGWRRGNQAVKNLDLWQELDRLVQTHRVAFHHVAGHSGHPENERCDALAVEAYRRLK